MNISKACKFTLVEPVAADGQTTLTSDSLDTQGFGACAFIYTIGTITSTGTVAMKLQQSSDNGVADGFSDIEGSNIAATDTASDKLLIADVVTSQKRYVRAVVTRGTADSVGGGIVGILYAPDKEPVTQPASVLSAELHVSPAEGTA
jgi:hypothetical protein